MKKYLFFLFFLVAITSCNNEEIFSENTENENQAPDIEVVNISSDGLRSTNSKDEFALKFRDEDVLRKTLDKLDSYSFQEKMDWSKSVGKFLSINSLYEQAMIEADSLDFTEEQYYEFKKKYEDYLYFPEYMDDYGAYLPYSDKNKVIIASISGKFLVGDQVLELDKITTYDSLQEYGLAYYSKEESSEIDPIIETRNTKGTVNIPWNRIKTSQHTEEYSSGWQKVGNGKKLQVKFGIRNMLVRGKDICFHNEVSFRKKGFLGKWYNYSSKTSVKGLIVPEYIPDDVAVDINKILQTPDGYYKGPFISSGYTFTASHSGSSSHDYYTKVPDDFYLYQNNDSHIFKSYKLILEVNYRGMSETKVYTHTFKRSYSKMIQNKSIWTSTVKPILIKGTIAIGAVIGEVIASVILDLAGVPVPTNK